MRQITCDKLRQGSNNRQVPEFLSVAVPIVPGSRPLLRIGGSIPITPLSQNAPFGAALAGVAEKGSLSQKEDAWSCYITRDAGVPGSCSDTEFGNIAVGIAHLSPESQPKGWVSCDFSPLTLPPRNCFEPRNRKLGQLGKVPSHLQLLWVHLAWE